VLFWKHAGQFIMRNPLRRYYGHGHLHFITFSCYRRQPLLGSRRARDCFVKTLGEVRVRQGIRLAGYVVMPNHVHLLVSEPKTGNLSKVIQVLKQRASRAVRGKRRRIPRGQMRLDFQETLLEAKHLWQRRFYDFNVWNWRKVREKLDYMHANPVKRKLVSHPRDWPWSSWSYYEMDQQGMIRMDAFGEEENSLETPQPARTKSQNPHRP
jgi:putative transposase